MLFDVKERTRTTPKKPGESDFAFYDSSARREYDLYRGLLNGWISELPEADRAEIVSRMQKGNSLQYQAALAELTTHGCRSRRGKRSATYALSLSQRMQLCCSNVDFA